MNESLKRGFFSVVFVLIVLAVSIVVRTLRRQRDLVDLEQHGVWVVGYFDQFTHWKKQEVAQYHFQAEGKTFYSFVPKDQVLSPGGFRRTNCLPVVYEMDNPDNNQVILASGVPDELHLVVPDPVSRRVEQATHQLELAAKPYPYPTELKNDYRLRYNFDVIGQYLSLIHGSADTIRKRLVGADIESSFGNLGYLITDLGPCFLLGHAVDGGQRVPIQLFDKSTGDNLIAANARLISVDSLAGRIIYFVPGGADTVQRIFVCDAGSGLTRGRVRRPDHAGP